MYADDSTLYTSDLSVSNSDLSVSNLETILQKVLLLRRIKPYITLEMRKLYYNSYILPIIDYGIILWQYAPKR